MTLPTVSATATATYYVLQATTTPDASLRGFNASALLANNATASPLPYEQCIYNCAYIGKIPVAAIVLPLVLVVGLGVLGLFISRCRHHGRSSPDYTSFPEEPHPPVSSLVIPS